MDALIFDVDGTLALTEEAHRQAFNDTFAAYGLDLTWDRATYGRLLRVAGGRERLAHWFRQTDPDRLAAEGADWIARMHRDKTARFQHMLEDGAVTLRPGVARLLEEARRAGLRLGIATTTHGGNLEALLRANLGGDAIGWFTAVCQGGDVTAKKPAPDLYLCALERLGLPASACVAIEDAEIGLAAARAAGIATLVTVNDYTRDDDFSGALAVVDGLGEPGAPARRLDAPDAGAGLLVTLEWLKTLTGCR